MRGEGGNRINAPRGNTNLAQANDLDERALQQSQPCKGGTNNTPGNAPMNFVSPRWGWVKFGGHCPKALPWAKIALPLWGEITQKVLLEICQKVLFGNLECGSLLPLLED
jgi:hypothetical protein